MDLLALQEGVVHFPNGSRASSRVLVLHDGVALGSSVSIGRDVDVDHVASLSHVVLQVLPGDLRGQVAHVHSGVLASSAAASGASLSVLSDEDGSAHEVGVVQGVDGGLSLLFRGELDHTAASRPAVVLGEHVGSDHVASLSHVILQVLPSHVPGQVAHVHSSALGAAGRALAASGREGLLSVFSKEDGSAGELNVGERVDGVLGVVHGGELDDGATPGSTCGGGYRENGEREGKGRGKG